MQIQVPNMRTKASNQNKFLRILTIPIRVLSKARDFYVRSMTDCAERVSYGNVMGGPAGQLSSLPKSFSVSSSRSDDGEDLRELIRATSTRSLGNRVELDLYMKQQVKQSPAVVPRSCSVGMGRIDEDRPCDFGEDNVNVKAELLYPRSRSYAVTKRSVVF
ncbi:hypothetical protein F0562_035802 [Nyssa sinensis]|uniref:Uncharacterized protein n=1 Tax=Nyssa sinensis TaxID=561372 RepID=A0A5J5AG71_9ASTE|nr:hypothetical protein F0562_035802 [Nyssa sinensis]